MVSLEREYIVKALKGFKCLAKQDLLLSALTAEPDYWSRQAAARHQTYKLLIKMTEEQGVDYAYRQARKEYANLPLFSFPIPNSPELEGRLQAFQSFFQLIGLPANRSQSRKAGNGTPLSAKEGKAGALAQL